ncbi:ABC-type dipeptide/oligopeptide/nickel transport system, permease component [Bacillus sp. 491mf]|uniref:ABC transporter permease subunit n=1 Tax=Bacillus TaxID=1386 RepID=UPI000552E3D3|nr:MULTISPECIES: ABC transporter permease subunit [unclassified Bacillus (in: firmicutes)]SFC92336.1 ABC-type dipeptide/oligopeptide/nickel transport system, permease component [Bacillus sp. 491mf]
MLRKLWKSSMQLLTVFITLLILLNIPSLFINESRNISFQPSQFIQAIAKMGKQIFSLHSLTFQIPTPTGNFKTVPLFPSVLEPYMYSFTILFAALFLSLFVAISIAYFYFLSSKRFKNMIQRTVFVLEAIPDVMIMLCIQMFFIWYFRQTGELPVHIMTFNEKKAYILPILCLSILPTIQMFRMMILYIEEERIKPYVEVAYGKGLSSSYIIRKHLFKNIFIHLFHHSKMIFVFLLSNLFVLECVFHMSGIIQFLILTNHFSTSITFIVLLMMVMPFYLLFQICSYFMKRWQTQMNGEII